MLTYFTSASNDYTIRIEPITSTNIILSLQNMSTLQNSTASLSGITTSSYESILAFTASISGAVSGDEYRAKILVSGSTEAVWNGAFQVFVSQSEDKPSYRNQVPLGESGSDNFKSHTSSNSYIILN